MPIVSVAWDVARFRATLDDFGRKQLPFATALALNETARFAAAEVTRALPEIFQRVTPFTRRAIGIKAARKTNLRAEVFVKRIQAQYLAIEATGGTRIWAPGKPILTPVNVALNAYRNIPRGTLRKLLANPKRYFLGEVRGVYGVWERLPRHRLKLIVALRSRATWRARFDFGRRVDGAVAARFVPALSRGLAKALATAVRA